MAGRRACGFVIFRRFYGSVEYLLMQTSYGSYHWTPPKVRLLGTVSYVRFFDDAGHVDPGETDMETALRETEEEAGFSAKDLNIFEEAKRELVYQVKGKPKTVIYWLAEMVNAQKDARLSHEHQKFRWLQLQEACHLAGYSEMQDTLKYFDGYIIDNHL
ncbi:bis(5'-nucleosyl)-tetraphosphatase [asymmetrical] isoform X1 [Athalia rosae]|uniref:bis(5'-nucleosyl)-tetraphosphatase [asymmetrical] isoform X1 n=1 Tax=Athalia rosae TaxID=37344 RepID=UPI002034520E|nr:bis(5'-nucleosyl)-tetraphosphatase [asymmetrical] isoform X1 [Athalia rosae]